MIPVTTAMGPTAWTMHLSPALAPEHDVVMDRPLSVAPPTLTSSLAPDAATTVPKRTGLDSDGGAQKISGQG